MYFNYTAANFEDSNLAKSLGFELCNTSEQIFWYFSATGKTNVIVGVGLSEDSDHEILIVSREDASPTAEDKIIMAVILDFFIYGEEHKQKQLTFVAGAIENLGSEPLNINGCSLLKSNEGRGGYECRKSIQH